MTGEVEVPVNTVGEGRRNASCWGQYLQTSLAGGRSDPGKCSSSVPSFLQASSLFAPCLLHRTLVCRGHHAIWSEADWWLLTKFWRIPTRWKPRFRAEYVAWSWPFCGKSLTWLNYCKKELDV